MGFWQGMAKAVGEISEENFTRRERQKDRDLQTKRDEEGRKHDFALADHRARLEERQAELLQKLTRRKEAEKESKVVAEALNLGKSLFGEKATFALYSSGRLNTILEAHDEGKLTDDRVASIGFFAEKFWDSIPKEHRDTFITKLAEEGESAAFDYLGGVSVSPMGSLEPRDSLDGIQIMNKAKEFTAGLLGAEYKETENGNIQLVKPQDYNLQKLNSFTFAVTKRIEELQPTMGFTRAAELTFEEFEPRLEEFGLNRTRVSRPSSKTPTEATQDMVDDIIGVDPQSAFGEDIDRLMDEQ